MRAIQYSINVTKIAGTNIEFNMTFEDVNGDIFIVRQTIDGSREKQLEVFQRLPQYDMELTPLLPEHKRAVLAFRSQKIALGWDNY